MTSIDKILDNGSSHIRVYNKRSIKVFDNNSINISNKAITIMPNFQIELGRSINDVIKSLSYTNLPVIIEEYLNTGEVFKYYRVIRLSTGSIPEYAICKLGVSHNRVTEVVFESQLAKNKLARKCKCVSAIASVAIEISGISSIEMDAINTISMLTRSKANNYECTVADYKLSVKAKYDNYTIMYTYIIDKENTKRYNLMGVNYLDK